MEKLRFKQRRNDSDQRAQMKYPIFEKLNWTGDWFNF